MRRRLITLLAVALVGVAAAGCGGGGSDEPTVPEFEQAVVANIDRANFALQRIAKAKSAEELYTRMDEASAAVGDASSELDDTGAPPEFAEQADKLVTSLDQLAVDLQATAADFQNPELGFGEGNLPRGLEFDSWTNANEALAAMVGDGLTVPILQG